MDLFIVPQSISLSSIVGASHDGTMAGVAIFLSILFSLNLLLFTFNLMPLPPLDGSGIIPLLLSRERAVAYMAFIHNSHLSFLGIFLAWNSFGYIFRPVFRTFVNLLYPGYL